MLGDLIAQLDDPRVCGHIMATLDPMISYRLVQSAEAASMSVPDFAAGAVRAFVEQAEDDLWFQLLTVMRKSEEPGIVAVQTILRWVVTEQESHS
jgi:hypothetical protein